MKYLCKSVLLIIFFTHNLSLSKTVLSDSLFYLLRSETSSVEFNQDSLGDGNISNLSFINGFFKRCVFKNINFSNCNFNGTHFESSLFENCTFDNCNFEKSTWKFSIFKKCTFKNGQVIGKESFGYTFHVGSEFHKMRMRNLYFIGTRFWNSIFNKSNFDSTAFAGANFKGSKFTKCSLSETQFVYSSFSSIENPIENNFCKTSTLKNTYMGKKATKIIKKQCKEKLNSDINNNDNIKTNFSDFLKYMQHSYMDIDDVKKLDKGKVDVNFYDYILMIDKAIMGLINMEPALYSKDAFKGKFITKLDKYMMNKLSNRLHHILFTFEDSFYFSIKNLEKEDKIIFDIINSK